MKSKNKQVKITQSNNNSVESSWRQKLFDIFVESYTRNQNLTNARALDLNEIVKFRIDKKNAHKSISEVEADNHLHIYLILRNDISVLPDDDIRLLQCNDTFGILTINNSTGLIGVRLVLLLIFCEKLFLSSIYFNLWYLSYLW